MQTGARSRHTPGPSRGDLRRTALLDALERLLAERPLAEIGISDISRAAGVTRSAFYFYFPTKPAAVSALLADFFDDMRAVAAAWLTGDADDPVPELQETLREASRLWRQRAELLAAMLDAIGSDPEVRTLWDEWVQDFVGLMADRIARDRAAGLTHADVDPPALATVLMGGALQAMERDVRALVAGQPVPVAITAALLDSWRRAIYPVP